MRDLQSNTVSTNEKQIDGSGALLATITDTPDTTGGTTRTIDTTSDGQPIQLTQHASAAALANGEQAGDYSTTAITINGQPAVNSSLIAAVLDGAYPSAKDIILNRGTGEFTHIVEAGDPTNPNGTSASLAVVTGRSDWWNDPVIGAFASDTVSLISALRSGRPLPIASAGLNFASHNFNDPAVAQIAAALADASTLASLVDSIEKGDLGRILIDGGGVARTALGVYSNSLTQQMISQYGSVFRAGELATQGNAAATEIYNQGLGVDNLLKGLGQAIVVLNIINSLANGDVKGAVLSAITYFFPVAGAILTVADLLFTNFFEKKAQFEADGQFVVGVDGTISVELGNHNGGAQTAYLKSMNALLEQTQKQAQTLGERNGQPMGLIAERLPTIFFKEDAMFLRYNDPLTGEQFIRSFDLNGKYLAAGYVENIVNSDGTTILSGPWANYPNSPQNGGGGFEDPRDQNPNQGNFHQIVRNDNFFDSLARQYSDAVTASGAIAPLWQVQTVNLQRQAGDPNPNINLAGLTTEQTAYRLGTSYAHPAKGTEVGYVWLAHPGDVRPGSYQPNGFPLTETSQQTATVIALDLNRDGVITTTQKATGNGVLFDVDNDGYAEETDWIGPRDGILVLDRTSSGQAADGQINRGADLFIDTWVDGTKRQLSVLNEIDDGFYQPGINNIGGEVVDPVFAHLRVWQDINGDGVAQKAELQSLAQLGITSLNWNAANISCRFAKKLTPRFISP